MAFGVNGVTDVKVYGRVMMKRSKGDFGSATTRGRSVIVLDVFRLNGSGSSKA